MERPAPIRIEVLARRPELAEMVAHWHWKEWGHLTPTLSLDARVAGVRDQAASMFVALEDGEAVGTAGFVERDMDTHPELGPWIAGVYVHPDSRRRGIAAALTRHVAAVAATGGAEKLYLFTDAAQSYWERLGWYRIADEQYLGEVVSIMGFDL